ncbi:hypothetical protein [Herbidospora daliensis]|uniref:hypothetical protein n=1 Tax=Herbidospora daliensis TaxID=295585 RepID=UPI000ABA1B8C|nr:hypothetical protein [Herbidospora daliensis]
MKPSQAKLAVGIALGYYFGRNHKLALATAVAVGGLAGALRPKSLLGKGLKSLGSPELEELAGKLQTDLMEAGRAAATAATTGPINQLSDRIHDKAERLRSPLGTKTKTAEKTSTEQNSNGEDS